MKALVVPACLIAVACSRAPEPPTMAKAASTGSRPAPSGHVRIGSDNSPANRPLAAPQGEDPIAQLAQLRHLQLLASKIALVRSQNRDVRRLAGQIAREQAATSRRLQRESNRKGSVITNEMEHDAALTRLRRIDAGHFDAAYLETLEALYHQLLQHIHAPLIGRLSEFDKAALETRDQWAPYVERAQILKSQLHDPSPRS